MSKQISTSSRRRFLQILGAASISALLDPTLTFASASKYVWRGSALGAAADMTLVGLDRAHAAALTKKCLEEIERLEKIFSLFVPGSAIRTLNKNGLLKNPPSELVEVLIEANKLSELSSGAFDVSIQPLWQYLYYLDRQPDSKKLEELRQLVDFRRIDIDSKQIRFARNGMQVTLNGIAQGYITDKVKELLRAERVENVLVQLGESFGLGSNAAGDAWRVGISSPDGRSLFDVVDLTNKALATSGAYGTRFGPNNSLHHLLNPHDAFSSERYKSLSVVSSSATHADGLSTALSLLERKFHQRVLKHYDGAEALIF